MIRLSPRHPPITTALILGLACASSTARANPFVGSEQLIASSPAPAWMKEGVRLTFRTYGGTIPDPNKPNETGSGGMGITELNVVAVARGQAALATRSYMQGITAQGTPTAEPVFMTEYGSVVPVSFGEFWAEPSLLRKVAQSLPPQGPWKVNQGPWKFGDKQLQAYVFSTGGGQQDKTRTQYVYDAESGLCIWQSESQRHNLGDTFRPVGSNELLGIRDLNLPWAMKARPPAWLFTKKEFIYAGSQIIAFPGSPPFQFGIENRLTMKATGANWAAYDTSQVMTFPGAAPQTYQGNLRLSGPAQFGGLWIPPEVLPTLRAGQEIDRDPLTGVRTTVEFVGRGQHGRNVVTIKEQNSAYEFWTDYEVETGILLLATLKDYPAYKSTQLQLASIR